MHTPYLASESRVVVLTVCKISDTDESVCGWRSLFFPRDPATRRAVGPQSGSIGYPLPLRLPTPWTVATAPGSVITYTLAEVHDRLYPPVPSNNPPTVTTMGLSLS
jgi:hypothetical protein